MRRNRKRHVRIIYMPPLAAGVIVLAVTVALVYGVADSKCVQLGQEIRKQEIKYATLENERVRESARWDEKKTPEKLERAMLQHGLAMNYARPEQVVRMDASGRPVEGQVSLTKYQRRSAIGQMVLQNDRR